MGRRTDLVDLWIRRVDRSRHRQVLLAVLFRLGIIAASSSAPAPIAPLSRRTHQRSVRYNSVIPTNARLALLRSSLSSSRSGTEPALPSSPSLARSKTESLDWRIARALEKWMRDSSGVESWAR